MRENSNTVIEKSQQNIKENRCKTESALINASNEMTNEEIREILEDCCGERTDIKEIFKLNYIEENKIGVKDILDLCGFSRDINSIYSLDIYSFNAEGPSKGRNNEIIYVKIKSTEIDEMNRIIDFRNKEITLNKLKVNKLNVNKGIGEEALKKLIASAKKLGFRKISLKGGRERGLDKKYKSKGYSFYPNRGFLATEKENTAPKRIKKIKSSKDPEIYQCESVNELFALEDGKTGEKIGLKFWKKRGDSIDLEMYI